VEQQYILILVSFSPLAVVVSGCYHYFVEFISPAAVKSLARREKGGKYNYRKDAEQEQLRRKEMRQLGEDELAVSKVFA